MSRETSRDDKPYSVRLPPRQAKGLGIVARVEGVNVSEALRAAVGDYLSRRLADEGFQKRLGRELVEEREVIKSLSPRADA